MKYRRLKGLALLMAALLAVLAPLAMAENMQSSPPVSLEGLVTAGSTPADVPETFGVIVPVTQKIAFYDREGGSMLLRITVTEGSLIADPGVYATYSAYPGLGTFLGWAWNPQGDGAMFIDFARDRVPLVGEDTTIAIYGMWRTDAFKVRYDTDGGTGIVVEDNGTYFLSDTVTVMDGFGLTKEGVPFVYWRKADGTVLQAGDTFTINGDTKLTAVYDTAAVNFTTITYTNGYDPSEPARVDKLPAGHDAVLRGNDTFLREGYALTGWLNTVTGETYACGSTFPLEDAPLTLAALWQAQDITISFITDGNGTLQGQTAFAAVHGDRLGDIAPATHWPMPMADAYFSFETWSPAYDADMILTEDVVFTATFTPYKLIRGFHLLQDTTEWLADPTVLRLPTGASYYVEPLELEGYKPTWYGVAGTVGEEDLDFAIFYVPVPEEETEEAEEEDPYAGITFRIGYQDQPDLTAGDGTALDGVYTILDEDVPRAGISAYNIGDCAE